MNPRPMSRVVLTDQVSSAPTVFSSLDLAFVPNNTEEKQQGEAVKYRGHEMIWQP